MNDDQASAATAAASSGHILGSKDVSRQVAAMMTDALAKNAAIGHVTAGLGAAPAGRGGGLLDMATPMLDAHRDGSVADDVTGMLGKFLGRR